MPFQRFLFFHAYQNITTSIYRNVQIVGEFREVQFSFWATATSHVDIGPKTTYSGRPNQSSEGCFLVNYFMSYLNTMIKIENKICNAIHNISLVFYEINWMHIYLFILFSNIQGEQKSRINIKEKLKRKFRFRFYRKNINLNVDNFSSYSMG